MFPLSLTINKAIELIKTHTQKTEASKGIQDAIFQRIKEYDFLVVHLIFSYPQKAIESRHTVKCYVPNGVAYVLKKNPKLVSQAVTSFYYRDVDGMKVSYHFTFLDASVCFKDGKIFTRKKSACNGYHDEMSLCTATKATVFPSKAFWKSTSF